jgi:membrane protein implicated in regulation of membrane protease activity
MWCHVLVFGFPVAGLLLFAVLPFRVAAAVYVPLSALSIGLGVLVMRALMRPARTGAEAMPGHAGRVESIEDGVALVRVNGELWRARSAESLAPGRRVIVVRVDGLTAVVRAAPGSGAAP